MCVSVTLSSAKFASGGAVAVTGRAVFHVLAVNSSVAGATVTACGVLPPVAAIVTVTVPPTGRVASRTVYAVLPSVGSASVSGSGPASAIAGVAGYASSVTPRASLSVTVTVTPGTRAGIVPSNPW